MLKLKNKKIVVTGGSGTIGKVLVRKLKRRGAKVLSLSSKNDIRKTEDLDFTGADIVIHLAAKLGGEKKELYEVNVLGTRNVMDEVIRAGVKRFVYVSTIMVFADTKGKIRDENYQKRKNDDHWYADSKIKALDLVLKEKRLSPIVVYPCVVLTGKGKGLIKPGKIMSLVGKKKRMCNYVSLERVTDLMIKVIEFGKEGEDYILGDKNVMMKDYWWLGKLIRVPNFVAKMVLGFVPADMYFSCRKVNSI